MYVADYSDPEYIKIGEHKVSLPKMPPENEIVNYDKKTLDQKYQRIIIPKDLHKQRKGDIDKFADDLYHIRDNGRWQFIKGQPFYIPGIFELFMADWETERGGLPTFMMRSLQFWQFFDWVYRDPNSFGMLVFKPRRIGDTENVLAIMYYMAAKYRKFWAGHQNMTEQDGQENFDRILTAHEHASFLLKPIARTTSKRIDFKIPEERQTLKKLREGRESVSLIDALGSRIDYKALVVKAYDGKRLGLWYGDEIGKWTGVNCNEVWKIVKPTLALEGLSEIIGKAVCTTTIEDIENSDTLKNAKKLWDDSDPLKKDKNGRTPSGLTRLFRSADMIKGWDEWGFHDKKAARKWIANTIDGLEKIGDHEGIVSHKRRFPLKVEDALAVPALQCVLLPVLLDKQIRMLDKGEYPDGEKFESQEVRGDFIWRDGKVGGKVAFVENISGKAIITQFPSSPNMIRMEDGFWVPNNTDKYICGVDPTDNYSESEMNQLRKINKSTSNQSSGAIVVKRRFDPYVDNEANGIEFDSNGEILNPWKMKTDRIVCDLIHKYDNPEDLFDDLLKVCIFFGCEAYMETNKAYVRNRFVNEGWKAFLKRRPISSMPNPEKFRGIPTLGQAASTDTPRLYTDLLKAYIKKRISTVHHRRVIEQWREYKFSNRTFLDLAVASGFCEIGDMPDYFEVEQEEVTNEWDDLNFFTTSKAIDYV